MKRVKKILSLVLVVCMLMTVLPVSVNAEATATPEITDYQTFLKNLAVLEEYAVAYSAENPGKDPASLTMQYIRTGVEEYNTGFWNSIASNEDSRFAAYVQNKETAYNASASADGQVNVSGLKNLGLIKTPNGDTVDIGHMFAVMDICYQNGGSNVHMDVAGWASDLVDLMVLADSEKVSGTLDEMVQQISEELFLQAGFNQAEWFGDLDGYVMVKKLISDGYSSGAISSTVEGYFTQMLTDEQRADGFLKDRMAGVTARSDIRDAVFNGYTRNYLVAALEDSQNFDAQDLSDLRKACCYVFADYLCMLAGDYVEWNENIYYEVQEREKMMLTSGISYEEITALSSDNKQMVYHIAIADVSNPYVNLYVNYKSREPKFLEATGDYNWGMSTVRDQASAAEAFYSNPDSDNYIPNYNIVVAVNGAGYNMTTGEPAGLLMMGGVEYQAPDGADHNGYGFFGILKDGSAIIGSTEEYYDLKEQGLLMEGIDNFGYTLVKDGEIAVKHSPSYVNARETRTAIGITKTGKVVTMVLNGRQEPFSCGGSMQEIAQIMLDAGCVDAINLDGGGSSTFLAQKPGQEKLSVMNTPSDGFERSVSTSLIIVSTMPASDSFAYAEVDATNAYLTVGTQVQMEATGINYAGNAMELPEDAVWTVSDSNVASISNEGILTGLKTGQVEVGLKLEGQTVGCKTMQVVVPDTVYFTKQTMSVARGETVTLPVVALYEGKQVAIHKRDLTITLSNDAGMVTDFQFAADTDATVKSVVITASVAENAAVADSMTVMLHNEGDSFFDFNRATGGDDRLAWLCVVSNATTGNSLTYSVMDTEKPMTTSYTVAFDATQLPVDAQLQEQVYAQLQEQMYALRDVDEKTKDAFLLQLADKVSTDSTVTVQLAFDDNLAVDVSKVALTSELFELKSADLDSQSNTLSLVLKWKGQAAPLSRENTNTVCILTGVAAEPKKDAEWDVRKRLNLVNEIGMEYAIVVKSDALYAYAQSNPSQGIAQYDGTDKGGLIKDSYSAGKDDYVLINSLKNGWQFENGGYAYYVNSVRHTGVCKVGEFYYDFGQNGINAGQTKYTGLFQIDGVNHYAKDGILTGGIYDIKGEKYYFDENGVAYHGEKIIEEVKIVFSNGLLSGGYDGFITKNDGNVYHYENGQKSFGWVYVGENLYHFNTETGIMTTGTHVMPDAEAKAKGAYYDFADDGRTLWGYFNGYGYYYWAGEPRRDDWVKNGADPDLDAWYHTNGNGHYVTTPNPAETRQLELDGVTYTAVVIAYDGVEYTFDNTNGKLLKGNFALKDGKWYYFWAGSPVNDGWFEMDGKTYYAFTDGHLATGAVTIEGSCYMFDHQGALITDGVLLYATLSEGNKSMAVKLVNTDKDMTSARLAIWAANAGQEATMQWIDLKQVDDTSWVADITMCAFCVKETDTFELHVYGIVDGADGMIVHTTVNDMAPAEHDYADQYDYKCDGCGEERTVDMTRPMVDMFRMYNPNTGEHFYTGSMEERENLVAVGWHYEGVGFTFPLTTGKPVHRLFQSSTGEHLYTMDEEEKAALMADGWNYEGVAFNSGFENEVPQHRLHNPNVNVGAYHFTASSVEMQNLVNAGWEYQGVGWYSLGAQ